MFRSITIFFMTFCFLFFGIVSADAALSKNSDKFIPSGVKFSVVTSNELNSNSATVGQNVEAFFLEDLKYNNITIAPKGSAIIGNVVQNKKANKNNFAQTLVRFTAIRTPYNNRIPISALIDTKDKTGVLKGDKNNKDVIIPTNTKINIFFNQPITLIAQ